MRNPFACWHMRGHIAAAIYDDLDASQKDTLDRHLASCPRCSAEFRQLRLVARAVPVVHPELGCDLAPALQRRLAEERIRTPRLVPNLAWSGAAMALVAGLYLAWPMLQGTQPPEPTASLAVIPQSDLASVLTASAQLADKRDYSGAYEQLRNAVQTYPEDALAGTAQIQIADLAFGKLHWYDRAYAEYETLVVRYPAAVEASADRNLIRDRRDLLAESRQVNYASLEELDAAGAGGAEGFARMEQVITKYPGMLVASMAANKLADLAIAETDTDTDAPATRLHALETARDKSSDPVVVAQLTMEIGHTHRDELNDPEAAQQFYRQVAEGQNAVLAKMAQDLLDSLVPPPDGLGQTRTDAEGH